MKKAVVAIIVAAAENGVIGRDGALPWRIPEDFKWFKARTEGRPMIMGRKTWESLPRKPLPGRTNIIVTRQHAYVAPGAVVAGDLGSAVAVAHGEDPDEIMIIGGAELYQLALPMAQRIYLTSVHGEIKGDTCFPEFDRAAWEETVVGVYPASTERPIGYSFIILNRKDVHHERA